MFGVILPLDPVPIFFCYRRKNRFRNKMENFRFNHQSPPSMTIRPQSEETGSSSDNRHTRDNSSSALSRKEDEWDPTEEDELEDKDERSENEEHYCDEYSTDYENDDIVQQHAAIHVSEKNLVMYFCLLFLAKLGNFNDFNKNLFDILNLDY